MTDSPPAVLRIVLVDDHSLVREGLAGLLRYQADIELVGEAADANGALNVVARVRPNLVLMDIDMPGEDGIAATRRLKIAHPDLAVVMLTVPDDVDRFAEAVKAGAQGYLVKSVPQQGHRASE